MKRSEAISIIANHLKGRLSGNYMLFPEIEKKHTRELASTILKSLEDSGMLPPEIMRPLTSDEIDTFNSMLRYNDEPYSEKDTITDFDWEAEK